MPIIPTEFTALLVSDPAEPTAQPTLVGGVPVSAGIELQSTTRALLLDRMTTVQRDAIAVPANGMILYNSTTDKINSYQGGVWGAGGSGDVTGPAVSTDTAVAVYSGTTGKTILNTVVTLNPVTSIINGLVSLFSGNGTAAQPTYTFSANSTTGIYRKGVNTLGVSSNGGDALVIGPNAANAVNYMQILGSPTGVAPQIASFGADANVIATFSTKGTGFFSFITDNAGASTQQFQVSHTAAAVNFLQITGSATTNAIPLNAIGNDANISIAAVPKGTGAFLLPRGGSANPGIGFSGSNASITSGDYYVAGGGASSTYLGTSMNGTSVKAINNNAVLSIGTTTFDATFVNGLSLAAGTAPGGAVVNCVELYSSVNTGTNTILNLFAVIDGANPAGNIVNSTGLTAANFATGSANARSIALSINGTVYYIPASVVRS